MTRCMSPGCQTTAGCVCGQVGRITFGAYTPAPANDGCGTVIINTAALQAENRQLRDRIATLTSALEAAEARIASVRDQSVEGWRPIETAPRDGTKIILFFPTYRDGRVDVYRFNDLGGDDFPWETSDGWGSDVGDEDGPTHWRPLPAPPAPKQEGA